ncbi:MAG: hypothetical protein KDD33_06290 [Bdellovibrionales bacterium]|nr:hypothetical protein [Bdellovibrionales bacterium]
MAKKKKTTKKKTASPAKKKVAKKVSKKSAPKKAAKKKTASKAKKATKKVAKKAAKKKTASPTKKKVAKKAAKKVVKKATKKVAKKAAKKVEKPKASGKVPAKKAEAPKAETTKAKETAKKPQAQEKPAAAKRIQIQRDVVLTDAEGRVLCRVRDCDQPSVVEAYCRYHYLLYWKKIQIRKKILSEGKLEKFIEELTSRYPNKYLELIKRDLSTEADFMHAIQELEIDGSSSNESDEYDDDQSFIEEVRGVSDRGDNDRDENEY